MLMPAPKKLTDRKKNEKSLRQMMRDLEEVVTVTGKFIIEHKTRLDGHEQHIDSLHEKVRLQKTILADEQDGRVHLKELIEQQDKNLTNRIKDLAKTFRYEIAAIVSNIEYQQNEHDHTWKEDKDTLLRNDKLLFERDREVEEKLNALTDLVHKVDKNLFVVCATKTELDEASVCMAGSVEQLATRHQRERKILSKRLMWIEVIVAVEGVAILGLFIWGMLT